MQLSSQFLQNKKLDTRTDSPFQRRSAATRPSLVTHHPQVGDSASFLRKATPIRSARSAQFGGTNPFAAGNSSQVLANRNISDSAAKEAGKIAAKVMQGTGMGALGLGTVLVFTGLAVAPLGVIGLCVLTGGAVTMEFGQALLAWLSGE